MDDDYGVSNDLTEKIDTYLELLDLMALEGDQWALKMKDILHVGRMTFCRLIIMNQDDESLRRVLRGFPGFEFVSLRELARRLHVRYAVSRLT